MKISIIVAMGLNNEIGKDNGLLWKLPKDMAMFKAISNGHHCLMGRKTWESIPEKFRPLPGRTNIVVSRDPDYINKTDMSTSDEGPWITESIEDGIEFARERGAKEVMIIGGGQIYKQCLDTMATTIYLTVVKQEFPEATVFFPKIDETEWSVVKRTSHPADEKNLIDMDFIIMERTEE